MLRGPFFSHGEAELAENIVCSVNSLEKKGEQPDLLLPLFCYF